MLDVICEGRDGLNGGLLYSKGLERSSNDNMIGNEEVQVSAFWAMEMGSVSVLRSEATRYFNRYL